MSVKFTRQAQRDVFQVWQYIAETSVARADEMVDRINERCRQLAEFPMSGEPCDKYRVGLRRVIVSPYVIFYSPRSGGVQIVRILHSARDIDSLF
jgi:toxin ParE1/3/4